MIHLDTSVLVDALTGTRRSAAALRALIETGQRVAISVVVLSEWLRGPRQDAELAVRNREHFKTAIYFHCGGLDLHPAAR